MPGSRYDQTVSSGTLQLDATAGVLDITKEPFYLLCVRTYVCLLPTSSLNTNLQPLLCACTDDRVHRYRAARDSNMASEITTSSEELAEGEIASICAGMTTPDLLQHHCSNTIWEDIDTNAPWLRGVSTTKLIVACSPVPS